MLRIRALGDDDKARAAAGRRVQLNAVSAYLRRVFDDEESEAEPVAARRIGPVKGAEHFCVRLRGYGAAVIADLDVHRRSAVATGDKYAPTRRRIGHRIAHQIAQDSAEQDRVAQDMRAPWEDAKLHFARPHPF